MFKQLLKNKIARNAGWLIGGKIVQMLLSLFIGLLIARYLGPSNYGLINYAAAYTAFFMSICTLGINSVLVKELVDNPEKEGMVLGTSLVMRAISSILSALTIITIVFFVDREEPTTIIVVALSSIGVVFHIFEVFNYWFQSKLKSKVTAIVTLVAYIATSLYKLVLFALEKEVVYFALASSIDYICIAVLLLIAYKKNNGQRLSFSIDYGKSLLKKSAPFIVSGLMVSIYAQTDKLMLKQMIDEASVGYYSVSVSICNLWCFVLAAIIDSLYPSIMESWNKDKKVFERQNKLLYALIFYISVFVSLIFVLFGDLIVWILYGEAYLPAAKSLKIITWYTAFSYLGVARNAWIVCQGAQKHLIWVYASAAVANVILNLLLIPSLGIIGAAIASLSAQVITTMIVPFFIKSLRRNSVLMLEAIMLKDVIRRKDNT